VPWGIRAPGGRVASRQQAVIVRQVFEDHSTFAELVPEWRDLLKRSQINELALTPTWVRTWWDLFKDKRGLRLVTFRRDGKLVGLAPLLRRRVRHGGLIPSWQIELCCTGEAQEEEICSPYVGILVERGFETSVAESFVLGLFAGELGSWDELLLTSLLQTDSLLTPLVQSLKQCGAATTLEPINSASYVRLPADWDSYLASLPGQRRYFVRRTQRDLEAWLGKEGGERFASTRAELKQGRDILYDLHRQRWRAEGKDGVFDAPRFAKFHEAIMGAFIENGEAELELCWMERAGVPFAVLYNIIYNGRVYFYQSGRSLDVPKTVRPGIGIHLNAIKRHIGKGRAEYDFLEGAHFYKSQLASEERTLVCIRALSPALRSQGLHASRKLLTEATRQAKAALGQLKTRLGMQSTQPAEQPPKPPQSSDE
jgi:CelD/BcsL family acetyltransferase involved in cellulose biosynthesis